MISVLPSLLLTALIFIFAGRMVWQHLAQRHSPVVTMEDYSRARTALDSLFAETAVIKRIVATEDLEFVRSSGKGEVEQLFLKERKDLAIRWLRTTQKHVARLMDLHRSLASYTYEPSTGFEFRLEVKYRCFVLASNALLILLWWRGPFEAVRILGYTLKITENFCSVFDVRLDGTDTMKLIPVEESRLR